MRAEVSELFKECTKYTLDPYWQDIFHWCSLGKFPKGMKVSSEFIYILKKKEKNVYKIPSTVVELFELCLGIFRKVLGLRSPKDMEINQENIDKIKDFCRGPNVLWKDTSRGNRERLIIKYVIEMKKKYNMTSRQSKKMLADINAGMKFKVITADDIDFQNGHICGINKNIVIKPKEISVKKEQNGRSDPILVSTKQYIKDFALKSIYYEDG